MSKLQFGLELRSCFSPVSRRFMQSAAAQCVMCTTRMTKMVTSNAQKLIKLLLNSAKSEVTLHMVISNSFIQTVLTTLTLYLMLGYKTFSLLVKKKVSGTFKDFQRGIFAPLCPYHTTLNHPPGILPWYLFYFSPQCNVLFLRQTFDIF